MWRKHENADGKCHAEMPQMWGSVEGWRRWDLLGLKMPITDDEITYCENTKLSVNKV